MNLKELSLAAIDKLLEHWATDTAKSVAESREESAAVVEAVISSQLEIASRVENEVCARIVEGFDAFNEQLPIIAKRIRGRYAQIGAPPSPSPVGSWDWALAQMKAGKRVKRQAEHPSVFYHLDDNSRVVNAFDVAASLRTDDFEATDWRIADGEKA